MAIFDAIRACTADHTYTDGERAEVRRVASRLGVGDEALAAIESLARDEGELRRRRIDVVFGESVPYQDRG